MKYFLIALLLLASSFTSAIAGECPSNESLSHILKETFDNQEFDKYVAVKKLCAEERAKDEAIKMNKNKIEEKAEADSVAKEEMYDEIRKILEELYLKKCSS